MICPLLRNAFTALCLTTLCALTSPSVSAAKDFETEADLVAAVMPSFVNIYNRKVVAGDQQEDKASSAPLRVEDDVGSGFIVDADGIIVTNRHVIEGAYALFVGLADGSRVPAKLVGKALNFDFALIKIDVGHPLPVAKIGDSDTLRVGQRVIAVGNPLGYSSSASAGIISALHRNGGLSAYDDLIQTDATINQGNSGGPLFNMAGEVIGINQAIRTQNKGGSIGIGFSIPVNSARFLLDNVRKYGKPYIGWLGLVGQNFSVGMANALSLERGGVIIASLIPDGSAGRGGLRVGDIIRKFGDYTVPDITTLNRLVSASVDKDVPVVITRDGKPATITIKIFPSPQDLWATKLADIPQLQTMSDLGITFAPAVGAEGPHRLGSCRKQYRSHLGNPGW